METLSSAISVDRKKRTRPVSACENCRSKKVKCHLLPDKPICKGCAQSGKECLFRVEDLSPALRKERFPDYIPSLQPGTNAPNRRRRRKSLAQSLDAAEDEDDEDGSSIKIKKDNQGRPIKAKAVFRCFANPTKLAAPTVKTKSATQKAEHHQINPSSAQQSENSKRSSGVESNGLYNEQNGYQHSTELQQNGEINNAWPTHMHTGYATGHFHSQNGRTLYHASPPAHFSNGQSAHPIPVPFQSPSVHQNNFTQVTQHQQSPRHPFSVPNSTISGTPSLHSDRNVSSSRDEFASKSYTARSSVATPHSRNGNPAEWRSVPAAPIHANQQAKAMPPSPSPFAWSPDYAHQTLPAEQNGMSSHARMHTGSDQRPRLNSQGDKEQHWQSEHPTSHAPPPLPPVQSQQASALASRKSQSASSREGFSASSPSVGRNDLAAASQLQLLSADEKGFERMKRTITNEESSTTSKTRSNKATGDGHSSRPSVHGSAGSPNSSTHSKPPATFKKIALPFFRWFGATANTPGIRRIKVGVYHETDMDLGDRAGDDEEIGSESGDETHHDQDTSHIDMNPDPSVSAITQANLSSISNSGEAKTMVQPSPGAVSHTSLTHPSPSFGVGQQGSHQQSQHHFAADHSALSTTVRELFETNRPRYPRKDILVHLVNLFTKYFKASCFPWLDATELIASAESGELPAILANAICAMTARFSGHSDLQRVKNASESFADMAKVLVVPMLSWPSIDVIEALVILSYAEFGAGADAGLWMYVGMALRMATDLGLQHELTVRSMATQKQQERARYLFWAIVSLDRITCFGTGRPVTVRDDAYDCELPPLEVDSASDGFVFGHIVRTLLKRGRIGELLNRREDGLTLEQRGTQLRALWLDLAEYYESLPPELHFGVNTFRKLAAADKGCAFVYLHTLLQSTISLLNRPSLLRRFDRDFSMTAPSRLASIANHAAGTIVSILRFATDAGQHRIRSPEENEDVNPYIDCNPYLDQLILPAGRAFLSEREAAKETLRNLGHPAPLSRPMTANGEQSSSTTSRLKTTEETQENAYPNDLIQGLNTRRQYAQTNILTCQLVLDRVARWWSGASWPARALKQECEGALDESIGPDGTDEEAQPAPIRDVEMVLRWARARRNRAQRGTPTPSRRNSIVTLGHSTSAAGGSGEGQEGRESSNLTHLGAMESMAHMNQFDPTSGSPLGLGFSGSLGAASEVDVDALIDAWAKELGTIESTAAVQGDSFVPMNKSAVVPSSAFVPGGSTAPFQSLGIPSRTGYTPFGTPSAVTGRSLAPSRPTSRTRHRSDTENVAHVPANVHFGATEYIQHVGQSANQPHSYLDQDMSAWPYDVSGPMDINLSAMQMEEFFYSPPALIDGHSTVTTSQPIPLSDVHAPAQQQQGDVNNTMIMTPQGSAAAGYVHGDIIPFAQQTGNQLPPSHTHDHPSSHHPQHTSMEHQNLDILPPALLNAFNFHPAPSPYVPAFNQRPNDSHQNTRKE